MTSKRLNELEQLRKDIEALANGPIVQLHIDLDGALIAVRSDFNLVFNRVECDDWKAANKKTRTETILRWIHQAARKCRKLEAKRLRQRKKGVA